MIALRHFTFWAKAVQAMVLAAAVYFSLGASDAGSRYNDLNHRLMCTCSCNELLGECNHTSCPMSAPELSELSADIAAGMADKQIFDQFAAKYGATILAAPTTHGFDLVAWIAPFAVFLAAMLGTILLVRRWSAGKIETAPTGPVSDAMREEIRRETSGDGGY